MVIYNNIEEFAQHVYDVVKDRIQRKLDNCFVIFGAEGTGKSTLGLYLAYKIEEMANDQREQLKTYKGYEIRFDSINDVVYHGVELLRAFSKGGHIILVDEAINLLYSKEHMGNSFLAKQLATGRYLQNTLFVVIQNLRWLDPVIREHRARLFIMPRWDKELGYHAYVFSKNEARRLYEIQKRYGYSNIKLYEKLHPDIVFTEIKDPKFKKREELYEYVKEGADVLNTLMLFYGIQEKTFLKIIAGIELKENSISGLFKKRLEDILTKVAEDILYKKEIQRDKKIYIKEINKDAGYLAIATLIYKYKDLIDLDFTRDELNEIFNIIKNEIDKYKKD